MSINKVNTSPFGIQNSEIPVHGNGPDIGMILSMFGVNAPAGQGGKPGANPVVGQDPNVIAPSRMGNTTVGEWPYSMPNSGNSNIG